MSKESGPPDFGEFNTVVEKANAVEHANAVAGEEEARRAGEPAYRDNPEKFAAHKNPNVAKILPIMPEMNADNARSSRGVLDQAKDLVSGKVEQMRSLGDDELQAIRFQTNFEPEGFAASMAAEQIMEEREGGNKKLDPFVLKRADAAFNKASEVGSPRQATEDGLLKIPKNSPAIRANINGRRISGEVV